MWKLLSRNETLVLSEGKKSIMTNFMDHVLFLVLVFFPSLSSPDSGLCFPLSSAGKAHFLTVLSFHVKIASVRQPF